MPDEPAIAAAGPVRARFGPQPIALLPVLILLLGTLPLAGSRVELTPLLLVPAGCAVWVLRARVVAAPDGLAVCNGLGVRRLPWDEVEGLDVRKRRPVQLLRRGRGPLVLTALNRRDVPRLLAVARAAGRRPLRSE